MKKSFNQYLNFLPKDIIKQHLELPLNGLVSTSKLIEKLENELLDSGRFKESYIKLTELEKGILDMIALAGERGISLKEISEKCGKITDEEVIEALDTLLKTLMVYGTGGREERFYFFGEFGEYLEKISENGKDMVTHTGDSGQILECDGIIIGDIMSVLGMIFMETVNRLQDSGSFSKKTIQEVTNRLCSLKFFESKSRDVLARQLLSVITDFLESSDLITWEEGTARLCPRSESWLLKSYCDKSSDWRKYVEKICSSSLLHFSALQRVLSRDSNWVDYSWLLSRFYLSGDSVLNESMPREIMLYFISGAVDLLMDEMKIKGLMIGAEQNQAEPAMSVTVTPTFEVILPDAGNDRARFLLEIIGKFRNNQGLPIYKIDRESLYGGFDRGMDKERIMGELESYCSSAIPQNVIFMMNEWIKAYGVINFEELFVMKVDDSAILGKIETILKTGNRYIRKVLPGYGLVIEKRHYSEVFDLLKKLGYYPKPFRRISDTEQPYADNILDTYEKVASQIPAKTEFILPGIKNARYRKSSLGNNSKYGNELRSLPFNEMIHVIKYAVLMDFDLLMEYSENEQSPNLIKVKPIELGRDWKEPKLTAKELTTGENRHFILDNIRRVKVETS
jgi:hypothetical protein